MDTSLVCAIRDHAREYLDGRTTLDAFLAWFLPIAVGSRSADDVELRALTSEIELLWVNLTEDEISGDEFRAKLETVVGTIPSKP